MKRRSLLALLGIAPFTKLSVAAPVLEPAIIPTVAAPKVASTLLLTDAQRAPLIKMLKELQELGDKHTGKLA